MSAFQRDAFQNNAFQGEGEIIPVVVEVGVSPAGMAAARRLVRRRYIMPDGTLLIATTEEAFQWLRRYTEAAQEPAAKPPAKKTEAKTIRMPRIELEKRDVRFVPAMDSLPDTWKAVVSERFTYKPPPEVTRQAQERINRMRADDEAIIALMLWMN